MDITAVPPGFAPKGAHLWDSSKSLPLITGASVAAYSQSAPRPLWGTLLQCQPPDCRSRLAPPAGSLKADKRLT